MNPIKKIVLSFFAFASIIAIFSKNFMDWFIATFVPANVTVIASSPADGFLAVTSIVVFMAAGLTFPVAIFEAIRYVKPALYEKEKGALWKLLPASIALFILGAIVGTIMLSVVGLRFLSEFNVSFGLVNLWSLSNIFSIVVYLALVTGLAFQFPLVIAFLVRNKFIELGQLTQNRAYVFLGCLVVAAVLTPTGDIFNQLLMTAPLYLLFEGTIVYLKQKEVKLCSALAN